MQDVCRRISLLVSSMRAVSYTHLPPTAEHYREKINTFLKWWAKHGFEEIPQEADPKLESRRKAPSWRRICKTLLKNDYWCKGLSFGQTKRDMERQAQTIMKYMEL